MTTRQAQHDAKSRAKKIADGGMRLPGGVLGAKPAAALRRLLAGGYGPTITGVIAQALIDADADFDHLAEPGKKISPVR